MMITKRRAIRAAVTLILAASAGHYVQSGNGLFNSDDRQLSWQTSTAPAPISEGATAVLFLLPEDVDVPAAFAKTSAVHVTRLAEIPFFNDFDNRADAPTPVLLQSTCEISLSVLPKPNAIVEVSLIAPCHAGQRFLFEHAGIEFADTTNSDGVFSVDFPAMNAFLAYSVSFTDGKSADATTLSVDMDGIERIALSWRDVPALHIHSLEYGAVYGGTGHVWANSQAENKGSLQSFGSQDVLKPVFAEVYSFRPKDFANGRGVEVSFEAEVTALTCGTDIRGIAVYASAAEGGLQKSDLALAMPECGGPGGFLVVNNVFENIQLAQN